MPYRYLIILFLIFICGNIYAQDEIPDSLYARGNTALESKNYADAIRYTGCM